eukprot:CAMPEP_0117681792 /NCGR_PEP_ID=MMETSP0804-20121206/19208_1 /TAXON_ID=1074897 /ORGANISM="Tetraselmis astigmatica, Strain CCMP880" /LENGTH=206 /DNA_ID=CAMNT_0005491647 /DNA_START=508 /DNA_END=1125 /DNA_ORIENTATION=+
MAPRVGVTAAAVLIGVLILSACPAESRQLPTNPANLFAEDAVDRSKFACQLTDCGPTERCISLPFGAEKCWVMDCGPCKKAVVADLSDSPDMYCSPDQCGMNVTKCITVPVKGDVCWEVACPPCGIPGRDIPDSAGLQAAAVEKKGDEFYCSPDQCGMNVTKCITVPVKGDVCWEVACPPCGIPGRDIPDAAGLQAAAVEKKGDKK